MGELREGRRDWRMFWKEMHFSQAEGPEGLGNARLPSLAGRACAQHRGKALWECKVTPRWKGETGCEGPQARLKALPFIECPPGASLVFST